MLVFIVLDQHSRYNKSHLYFHAKSVDNEKTGNTPETVHPELNIFILRKTSHKIRTLDFDQ